jgi:squalene-associated FAD-dependent desaturase
MLNKRVAIVGCGVAGISVAYELHKLNIPHIIFEARNNIGGRIYSFNDSTTQMEIDNGQHLLSGAYSSFLEILQWLGTQQHLLFQKSLRVDFITQDNKTYCLNTGSLPFPFGTMLGILNFKILPLKSRFSLLHLFKKLKNGYVQTNQKQSILEFLVENNQDKKTISTFWEPFVFAVMNNSLDNVPITLFINTLKNAFFFKPENSRLVFPKVGLSRLLEPFEHKNSHCKISYNSYLEKIEKINDEFVLHIKGQGKFTSDVVFLCLPPNILSKVIPDDWKANPFFTFLPKVSFNTIISIYLWFDKPFFDGYFATFSNSEIHWIFNKNKILEQPNSKYFLYAFTKSYANEFTSMNDNELLKQALNALELYLPKSKLAKLLHYRIFKDKHATVNINTEFEELRPIQKTPIENLYLSGDWTNTALPATIESAAISGKFAVQYFAKKENLV